MTVWLRGLIAECVKPVAVNTDLSDCHSLSYAVTRRGQKQLAEDVAGRSRLRDSYTLNMRHPSVRETDRQRAYRRLEEIAVRLGQVKLPAVLAEGVVTAIKCSLPLFQEAYDDGMAVWSMGIETEWERK